MIEANEAVVIVLANARLMDVETVALQDARGRTLALDAIEDSDVPVADISAMDGFAVASADVESASRENSAALTVVETIAVGKLPCEKVGDERAARMRT